MQETPIIRNSPIQTGQLGYAANKSYRNLMDAESKFLKSEQLCLDHIFTIDSVLFHNLLEGWPLFRGQYQHLSDILKNTVDDIHLYTIQRTEQAYVQVKEFLEQRRNECDEMAMSDKIDSLQIDTYLASYDVFDQVRVRLQTLNTGLKTSLKLSSPPTKDRPITPLKKPTESKPSKNPTDSYSLLPKDSADAGQLPSPKTAVTYNDLASSD